MLKKLVPAVFGALLIAGPVLTVTTATAAPQSTAMKSHHKAMKHHKKSSHHMMKHSKAKKAPPKG